MKIILMRHGKPILPMIGWVPPVEMKQWIEHYDLSEVEIAGIPITSLTAANSASVIVTSTASRALSSVEALGHTATVIDAVFCEAPLPFPLWRFPRLAPSVWAAFFRVLWFFGYARGADSVEVTKVRARVAAEKLALLAVKDNVLLVGHGIMNRLIANELLGLGWSAHSKHHSKYWSTSVYSL